MYSIVPEVKKKLYTVSFVCVKANKKQKVSIMCN